MNIIKVSNLAEQTQSVISILNTFNKESYLLMLSGGQSPNGLYKYLSHSFNYTFPSDVALTDEIWQRQKFHENSNELMVKNTGLLGRVEWEKAGWHPILTDKTTPTEEAKRYAAELTGLFKKYGRNTAAILSMNADARIAGVLPNSVGVASMESVIYYGSNDQYEDRITATLDCVKNNFRNIVLLLDNKSKIETFENIMNKESDISKYPVLVLKDHQDVTVLGVDQD